MDLILLGCFRVIDVGDEVDDDLLDEAEIVVFRASVDVLSQHSYIVEEFSCA